MNIDNQLAAGSFGTIMTTRAQVMDFDAVCNGWIPYDGGGLSIIELKRIPKVSSGDKSNDALFVVPLESKRSTSSLPSSTTVKVVYIISACRLHDSKVLLNVQLTKDARLRKTSPLFHIWEIATKKFGLSFLSRPDAEVFSHKVHKAMEHLTSLDKSSSGNSKGEDSDDFEDDVFMPVQFPSQSGSSNEDGRDNSAIDSRYRTEAWITHTASVVRARPMVPAHTPLAKTSSLSEPLERPTANFFHRHQIHRSSADSNHSYVYLAPHSVMSKGVNRMLCPKYSAPALSNVVETDRPLPRPHSNGLQSINRPYRSSPNQPFLVPQYYDNPFFNKTDSLYGTKRVLPIEASPVVRIQPLKSGSIPTDLFYLDKSRLATPPFRGPGSKEVYFHRPRCMYCHKPYRPNDNRKGSCKVAPDGGQTCIEWITCYWAAQISYYACCTEEPAHHNVEFSTSGHFRPNSGGIPSTLAGRHRLTESQYADADTACGKFPWQKCLCISLMSPCLPCLCCYLPLTFINYLLKRCRICGPKHRPRLHAPNR